MFTVTIVTSLRKRGKIMSKKRAAFARKGNFWSEQRVKNNIQLKDVAQAVGMSENAVGMYFSGQNMPNEGIIRQICDLFDVPFSEGQLEFQHAHKTWKAEHGAKLAYSAKKPYQKKTTKTEINTVEDVLEALYGSLSCADFIAIYDFIKMDNITGIDPLEVLYGKVDFETYQKIIKLI